MCCLQRPGFEPVILRLFLAVVERLDQEGLRGAGHRPLRRAAVHAGQGRPHRSGSLLRLQGQSRTRHPRQGEPFAKGILNSNCEHKTCFFQCDACYMFPCSNGGTCQPTSDRGFRCQCAPGFHGKHCENMIDACFGNPCRNHGACKLLEEGRFRYFRSDIPSRDSRSCVCSCQCSAGFTGDRCESNIDECLNHKCENGATCVDLVEAYQCQCKPGYTG